MKNDKLYLIHISECIERIESYVTANDKSNFMASSLLQDAVMVRRKRRKMKLTI